MIQSNLSQCWCEDGNAQLRICLSIIIVANMFIYYPRRQDLQEQIINGEWWHCELIVARGRSIVREGGIGRCAFKSRQTARPPDRHCPLLYYACSADP